MVTELVSLALIYFAVIDPIGTIPIFYQLQSDLIINKSNGLPSGGVLSLSLYWCFLGSLGI